MIMFMRALINFILLPGVFAGAAPVLLASFDPWCNTTCLSGIIVMIVGIFIVLWCASKFFMIGKGTLAPWDPPKRLVIVGLYRFMRNPMYVGVLLVVIGWALYFLSILVAVYFVVLAVGFHVRVVLGEEPQLKILFEEEWEAYKSKVPRWLPRL
jgi:protein-S-isoprenylcysteine O-methyltransferase Ste14